ncbi:DsbA family protein [Aquipuribacter sp. MA13-6]|uniref:DsbA family protein n=1 Tax=unclassified Aquipuribacter TaxID=2635084 RepID=UPI003EEA3D26
MARNLDPRAREAKLEAIRRQNAADAKRARTLSIVAAVVVVVLVVVVVVVIALTSRGGGDDEAAEVVLPQSTRLTVADDENSGGFVIGEEGPVELVVFEDFQCPACKAFEETSGAYLAELAAGTDVTVVKRPISILDRVSDTQYSTRSAAAAACVGSTGDDEAYEAFAAALFAEQPDETAAGEGLSDERLSEIATDAGADVGDCIADGTYLGWVSVTTESADAQLERLSTPTVLVDGEVVAGTESSPPGPDQLRAAVAAAAAG